MKRPNRHSNPSKQRLNRRGDKFIKKAVKDEN